MDSWRKSSYSGTSGGNCIEVAGTASAIQVRDTADRDSAMITVPGAAWERFTAAIRHTA